MSILQFFTINAGTGTHSSQQQGINFGGSSQQVWEELTDEYSVTVTRDQGTSATRVFVRCERCNIENITGKFDEALPEIGDRHPDFTEAKVTSVSFEYNEGDIKALKATVEYSSDPNDFSDGSDKTSVDDLPRSVSLGPEHVQFEIPENWRSDYDIVCLDENNVEIPNSSFRQMAQKTGKPVVVNIRRLGGTIAITEVVKDFDQFIEAVVKTVGFVNDSLFYGFPRGCVLYGGADSSEFRNPDGFRRWKINHKFGVMVGNAGFNFDSNGNIIGVVGKGWNYIWRKEELRWRQAVVKDPQGNYQYIYPHTDLKVSLNLSAPQATP